MLFLLYGVRKITPTYCKWEIPVLFGVTFSHHFFLNKIALTFLSSLRVHSPRFENIKTLSKKYKAVNIVTNHVEKFKKLKIFGLSLQWEDGEDIAPELLYENSVLKRRV